MRPVTRIGLFIVVAAIGTAAGVPASETRWCSMDPFATVRHPVTAMLLGSAVAETLLAGTGDVKEGIGWTAATGRGIYGQVILLDRFAAADSALLATTLGARPPRRVLLVPWAYGPDCSIGPWHGPAQWIRTGEQGAYTARLRAREHWAGGMPTFDVFSAFWQPYPHGQFLRSSWYDTLRTADALTAAEYFDFTRRLPVYRPGGSVTRETARDIIAWAREEPHLAQKYPAHRIVHGIYWEIRNLSSVRYHQTIKPEIAGTYRLTFSLDGGEPRTVFVRTHRSVDLTWRISPPPPSDDPLQEYPRPDGYSLYASAAPSHERLPGVCEGRSGAEGYIEMLDPVRSPDHREAQWTGVIGVELVRRPFFDDTALASFDLAHARAHPKQGPFVARFWRDTTGTIAVQQTLEVDGRRLELVGERISDKIVRCSAVTAADSAEIVAERAAATRRIDTTVFVGRVRDEASGEPIAGASVLAVRQPFPGATTGPGGWYRLVVPRLLEDPRNYALAVTIPGYYLERQTVSVAAAMCVEPACAPLHPDTVDFVVRRAPHWSLLEVCSGSGCTSGDSSSPPPAGRSLDSVTVVGRVTDARTGEGIASATVRYESGRHTREVRADSLGFYRVMLPTGPAGPASYTMIADRYNYISYNREVAVPPRRCERVGCPSEPYTLNFPMQRIPRHHSSVRFRPYSPPATSQPD